MGGGKEKIIRFVHTTKDRKERGRSRSKNFRDKNAEMRRKY